MGNSYVPTQGTRSGCNDYGIMVLPSLTIATKHCQYMIYLGKVRSEVLPYNHVLYDQGEVIVVTC